MVLQYFGYIHQKLNEINKSLNSWYHACYLKRWLSQSLSDNFLALNIWINLFICNLVVYEFYDVCHQFWKRH